MANLIWKRVTLFWTNKSGCNWYKCLLQGGRSREVLQVPQDTSSLSLCYSHPCGCEYTPEGGERSCPFFGEILGNIINTNSQEERGGWKGRREHYETTKGKI
jgi:hypothetical protein